MSFGFTTLHGAGKSPHLGPLRAALLAYVIRGGGAAANVAAASGKAGKKGVRPLVDHDSIAQGPIFKWGLDTRQVTIQI